MDYLLIFVAIAATAACVWVANHLCGTLLYKMALTDHKAVNEVLAENGAPIIPTPPRVPGRPVRKWGPELLGGGLIGFAATFLGVEVAVLLVPLVIVTMALFICDLADHLLPDVLIFPLLWAGLAAAAFGVGTITPSDAIVGALAGYLSLWLIFTAAKAYYGFEAMGRGDLKLFAAIGAWLGAGALLPVILGASVVGAGWGLISKLMPRLAHKAMDDDPVGAMPFGPYLILSAWIWALLPGAIKSSHLPFLMF